MKKYSFLIIVAILMVFAIFSHVHAEDLVLEPDPDETNGVQNEISGEQKRAGYQQLFDLNREEMEGLQSVLIPLSQDISSLDLQLQTIALQRQRIRDVDFLLQEKIKGLKDYQEQLNTQGQWLQITMKSLLKKFEKTLAMIFAIKRQYVMEDGRINLLQLFASTESPSEALFQDFLLQMLERQLAEQMSLVSEQQMEFQLSQKELSRVQGQMLLDQERLQTSLHVLEEQALYEKRLFIEKKEEQAFFQKAFDEAKEEQETIRKRIELLAAGQPYRLYQDFPNEPINWPVNPLLGISTYFMDEEYRERFQIDHKGIDVPVDQLTPVMAALSGKVIKVADANTGYNYLQLMHRNGYSTVYGHIYESKVKEGDIVEQGQIIALSGGAIGTRGAGKLTTGPHLHFEILKDGQYVDPLRYLK